ncbi:Similar to Wee1 protein kinase [Arabidopsis thaliana]|nr:Similar to Wee1 protein kinase [Arabidopsis thaliana]
MFEKNGRTLLAKRKTQGTIKTRASKKIRKMEGTLERHSLLQFGQLSKISFENRPSSNVASSAFQGLLDSDSSELRNQLGSADSDANCGEKDFILSQDFFCTPDYITPDNQNLMSGLDISKDHSPCPRSPVKLNTVKSKRCRQESFTGNHSNSTWSSKHRVDEQENDDIDTDEVMGDKLQANQTERTGYVSQAAVALRCRAMPPPCLKNPYVLNQSETATDPFGHQRSKCASFLPVSTSGDGLSRYLTDFHEIRQIGAGHFSRVFKVLKRMDGCLYAVKHSTRKLYLDSERRKAMMEVQALAALGFHENIVGYYSSWFENEQLYIQLELCDHSLSALPKKSSLKVSEREILVIMHQIAKALHFVHEKGIAHLDVKPDNIYIKNGVCKLGDFGCATRLDKSLPVEEGDARYMPQEILNEDYEHLDKVDIFSLGVTVYELIKGSPLTESRNQSLNIKEGKLPLLPGHSLQLQQLLKTMMDRDPKRRPSARELLDHPMFDRIRGHTMVEWLKAKQNGEIFTVV